MARIINEPKRSIGATSFERMAQYAIDQDRSIFDALNEVDFMGLYCKSNKFSDCNFQRLISNFTKMQEFVSVTEIVEEVFEKSGYREMLKNEKTIEAESRLENIEEFLTVTKAFEEQSEDKSLGCFFNRFSTYFRY